MSRKIKRSDETVALDGQVVRSIRAGSGLTQTDVAERASLSKAYVSLIENQLVNRVSVEAASGIATALGVPLANLQRSPTPATEPEHATHVGEAAAWTLYNWPPTPSFFSGAGQKVYPVYVGDESPMADFPGRSYGGVYPSKPGIVSGQLTYEPLLPQSPSAQFQLTWPETTSDESLEDAINRALDEDMRTATADIHVRVSDGVATLTGTVPNKHIKVVAYALAANCPGIRDLRDAARVSGRVERWRLARHSHSDAAPLDESTADAYMEQPIPPTTP